MEKPLFPSSAFLSSPVAFSSTHRAVALTGLDRARSGTLDSSPLTQIGNRGTALPEPSSYSSFVQGQAFKLRHIITKMFPVKPGYQASLQENGSDNRIRVRLAGTRPFPAITAPTLIRPDIILIRKWCCALTLPITCLCPFLFSTAYMHTRTHTHTHLFICIDWQIYTHIFLFYFFHGACQRLSPPPLSAKNKQTDHILPCLQSLWRSCFPEDLQRSDG